MNRTASLERRYQRLLAWFPRGFRLEHEEEMLGLLMVGAKETQQRPGLADSANLIRCAVGMRLHPRGPQQAATVQAAVRLMVLGALVNAVAWVTYVTTAKSMHSAVLRNDPGNWTAVQGHLTTVEVFAPFAIALWLCLAWAKAAGRGWARGVFTAFFGVLTLSLILVLAEGGIASFAADAAATGVLWLTALSVVVLLHLPRRSVTT